MKNAKIIWKTKKGQTIRGDLIVDNHSAGRITLLPVSRDEKTHRRLLAANVQLPKEYPVYVLSEFKIIKNKRGRGYGKYLLNAAVNKLKDFHNHAWLGLMTDNFKKPTGRTRDDIRAVWNSFFAINPHKDVSDGFILV